MKNITILLVAALIAGPAFAAKDNPKTETPEKKPAIAATKEKAAPKKTREEPAVKTPKAAAKKIQHAAIGAKAKVSSTNKETDGESGATALIDGDLTTRWSSAYSAPQRITIELKKPIAIDRIRLHWEAAFATKYQILISDDGEGWTPAHYFFRMGEDKKPRIDNCSMKGVKAKFILIELNERVNPDWGFSLFEVEVIGSATPTPKK